MTPKDIRELRRVLQPEKNCITKIYGCYVNPDREIITRFEENVGELSQVEELKYITIFRDTLSGHLEKELINATCDSKADDAGKVQLLMDLKEAELKNPELRNKLYDRIINAVDMQGMSYVILLAFDNYDVPGYSPSGRKRETSVDVYRYFLCSVCPVKEGKMELDYEREEKRFHSAILSEIVTSPVLGFLYPAFNDRSADLSSALFYNRKAKGNEEDFMTAILGSFEAPLTLDEQRDAFGAALSSSLEKDCTFEIVQAVNDHFHNVMVLHEESKSDEPLVVTVEDVGDVLVQNGVGKEKAEAFQESCRESYGSSEISPENLMPNNKITIQAPGIKIVADPKFSHTIQAKEIDGKRYITIPLQSGVEINGVSVG